MKQYFFLLSSYQNLFKGKKPGLVLPIGYSSFVESIDHCYDGKKVVTGYKDKTAKVCDAETRKLLIELGKK